MLEFYTGCAIVIPCVILAVSDAERYLEAGIAAFSFGFFVPLLSGQHPPDDFWEMSTTYNSTSIHTLSIMAFLVVLFLFVSWIMVEFQRNGDLWFSALLFTGLFPVPYICGRVLCSQFRWP
jgi:hypothetical protein